MAGPMLPKEMAFHNSTGDAVAASSLRLTVTPYNNQTFKTTDVIKIKLPANKNHFFAPQKSYLKFTVNVPAAGAGTYPQGTTASWLSFDGHPASVIQKLQVYSGGGGTMLENTEQYGRLYNTFMDAQVGYSQRQSGTFSCLVGTNGDRTCIGMVPGTAETVSFGLISGVFGSQCQKMIPIGELSDGLELHLYLADFKSAFKQVTAPAGNIPLTAAQLTGNADALGAICANNITITDIQFVAEYVKVDDSVMSAIRNINGGKYVIPCEQYYTAVNTIGAASSGTQSNLINIRFKSLKNLFAGYYPTANENSMAFPSSTGRSKANLLSYQWRIGGMTVPQRPVICNNTATGFGGSEAFMELERALRGVNTTLGDCSLSRATYNMQNAGVLQNNLAGSFLIGTQLDVFDFTDGKPCRSGVSTLSDPIYFDPVFGTVNGVAGTPEALFQIVWGHFDGCLLIQDGQIYCDH
jgi:hypothetical protein